MKLPEWLNNPVFRKIAGLDPLPSSSSTEPEQASTSQEPEPEESVLFTPVQPKPSAGKRALRIAVWAVLILIFWIGIRTMIWGNGTRQAAAPVPISATFPTATAEGVASRFSVAFLTWQEGEAGAKARAEALKPFLATRGGDLDGKFGWNGKGTQKAENPTVISGDKRSSAGLEMTVQVIDGAGAVVGNPGVVAVPAAPTLPVERESTSTDSQLAGATKAEAQSFFTLFAASDNLDSVAAPGAKIRGLRGAWGTATVTAWTVNEGGPDRRAASAEVTFDKDGTQIKQTFTLSIVKVSSGTADQWKISEIHGG